MARILRADRRGPALRPAAVLDAQAQARAILAEAHAEASVLRERARAEGRTEGRAELAAAELAFATERDRQLAADAAAAVDAVLRVASHLAGEALVAEPARIASLVHHELERIRGAARVRVRVHPGDRAALEHACAERAGDDRLPRAIRVEPDASIARGGCVVESDVGTLDARLEVRIEALRAALLRP